MVRRRTDDPVRPDAARGHPRGLSRRAVQRQTGPPNSRHQRGPHHRRHDRALRPVRVRRRDLDRRTARHQRRTSAAPGRATGRRPDSAQRPPTPRRRRHPRGLQPHPHTREHRPPGRNRHLDHRRSRVEVHLRQHPDTHQRTLDGQGQGSGQGAVPSTPRRSRAGRDDVLRPRPGIPGPRPAPPHALRPHSERPDPERCPAARQPSQPLRHQLHRTLLPAHPRRTACGPEPAGRHRQERRPHP